MASGFSERYANLALGEVEDALVLARGIQRLRRPDFMDQFAIAESADALKRATFLKNAFTDSIGYDPSSENPKTDPLYEWIAANGRAKKIVATMSEAALQYSTLGSVGDNGFRGGERGFTATWQPGLELRVNFLTIELLRRGELVAIAPFDYMLAKGRHNEKYEEAKEEARSAAEDFYQARNDTPFRAAKSKWVNARDDSADEDFLPEGTCAGLLHFGENRGRKPERFEGLNYPFTPTGFINFSGRYHNILIEAPEKQGLRWADIQDEHGNIKRLVYLPEEQGMVIGFSTPEYSSRSAASHDPVRVESHPEDPSVQTEGFSLEDEIKYLRAMAERTTVQPSDALQRGSVKPEDEIPDRMRLATFMRNTVTDAYFHRSIVGTLLGRNIQTQSHRIDPKCIVGGSEKPTRSDKETRAAVARAIGNQPNPHAA
ncbi:MAG: hypothetical protein AAF413_00345 [Patescibacteria group bacterium]